MTNLPAITLAGGATIPAIGLGTSPMVGAQAQQVVALALRTGYRLIDTAENYRNEDAVGAGLRDSGIPRDQVFITTKFNAEWHGRDLVSKAFEGSAARLGIDHIDLLLIHWPNPWQDRYVEAWQGMLRLRDEGKVRAVGTSNFKPAHIDRLLAETGVAPEVNQIQLDPTLARVQARAYHADHRIVTEAWSPLGPGSGLLDQPAIAELAGRYGKSPAQIVLRWNVELGIVPIPKSADPGRLAANLDVFDFRLTPDEVAVVSALDRGEAAATDSDTTGH